MLNCAKDELFVIIIALLLALRQWNVPFTTVMMLVMLLGRTLSRLDKVQKLYRKLMARKSSFWSMGKIINQAREARENLNGGRLVQLPNAISLRRVSFIYAERNTLNWQSFEIPTRQSW